MKLKRQNSDKLTDSQLVWLYTETRDVQYVGELFLRYLSYIYGFFLNHTDSRESAKEALLSFYDTLSEPLLEDAHTMNNFDQWLYEKCSAYAKEHLADDVQEVEDDSSSELESEKLSATALEFIPKIGDQFDVANIEDYATLLSVPELRSFELFFVKRLSFSEIADETGYLHGDVQVYIERGLETIASAFEGKKIKEGGE